MGLSNWYRESFGQDYLNIYSHRDEREAIRDVKSIIELTGAKKNWNILDLCCGTGRHLNALSGMEYKNLWGLDLSPHLLEKAVENLHPVKFVRGDMRYIPFSEHFHLILSLFTSFGYFFSDNENLKVLKEINRCLYPGGKFLIDYINRPYLEKNLISSNVICKNGKKVISRRKFSSDGLRVEKEMEVIDGENKKIYNESVRLFTLEELINLMKKSDFININYYGGLNGEKLPESPRVTLTGEKKS